MIKPLVSCWKPEFPSSLSEQLSSAKEARRSASASSSREIYPHNSLPGSSDPTVVEPTLTRCECNPAARARLFEAALAADANLISLAGDTHNAWSFDLDHAGQRVGVEFGVQSVTSPGFEAYLPQLAPADLERASIEFNPELVWMDASRRGYMAVELTPTRATSEYRFLSSIRERGAGVVATQRVSTALGDRRLELA